MQSVGHNPAVQTVLTPWPVAVANAWRAELLPCSPYLANFTPKLPIVGFAFENQVGVHAFGTDRKVGFCAKPNGLAYVPVDCDVYSASDHGGEYLKITLALEDDGPWSSAQHFSNVIDQVAIVAAQGLRRQLLATDRTDPLQCERFVHTLKNRAACVLRANFVEPSAASWMTLRRFRLIQELIEARLSAKVSVQELADTLRLSAGFFSRAFKAAIGKAPYDYIVDCRVARARRLLERTELDLAAIAQASGFSSHAHMTATFRSRIGVSPSKLRSVKSRSRPTR